MSVITDCSLDGAGSVGLSTPGGSPKPQPYGLELDLDNVEEGVLKSDEFKM